MVSSEHGEMNESDREGTANSEAQLPVAAEEFGNQYSEIDSIGNNSIVAKVSWVRDT